MVRFGSSWTRIAPWDKNTEAYENAFWQQIYLIVKIGSLMKEMKNMIVDGSACVIPVKIYIIDKAINGHAFFTIGMQKMMEEGVMSRNTCPGFPKKTVW